MRRVVITGIGAVTPLGNDVESTWEGAPRGAAAWTSSARSTRASTRSTSPPRSRTSTERRPRAGQGAEAARPQRPVRLSAAKQAIDDAGIERLRAGPRRRRDRVRDRGAPRAAAPVRRAEGARARPCLTDVPPQHAARLGERPGRDRARAPGPELRGRLRLRDRLSRDRRGRRPRPPRRRRCGARGRDRGVHPPALLRRLLLDARARCRGGRSGARVAARSTRRGPGS